MLSIRLSRGGAKKRPYYRIVVAEKTAPRDGRFVELLGASNPMAAGDEPPLKLNVERYQYWLTKGALPTERIKRLVRGYQRSQKNLPSAEAAPESPPAPAAPTAPATPTANDAAPAAPVG